MWASPSSQPSRPSGTPPPSRRARLPELCMGLASSGCCVPSRMSPAGHPLSATPCPVPGRQSWSAWDMQAAHSRRSVPQGHGDREPATACLREGRETSPGMGTWVQPSRASGQALASRDPDTQTCLCCPLVPMAATAGHLGLARHSRGWSWGAGLGAHTRHGAGGGGPGLGLDQQTTKWFCPELGKEGTSGTPEATVPQLSQTVPGEGGAGMGPPPWVPQPLESGVANTLGHLVKQGSCSDGH